jgi:DNA-binding NtrC family response regulator
MPGMNGVEMVRKIYEVNPHSNVVLMTGYNPEFVVPADMRKGCGLLSKPFTIAQVLEAVEKCLNSQKRPERGEENAATA